MDTKQIEYVEKVILQTLDGYFEAASQCDARKFLSSFVDANEMTVIENATCWGNTREQIRCC